ncbi:MAG: hypothetical protein GXY82_10025 [Methanospirillum sp.]|nr:hypothetical protein [Methanospirillum sp.]
MRLSLVLSVALVALAAVAWPVAAFEADLLEIAVDPGGDAVATLHFSPNRVEVACLRLAGAAPVHGLEALLSAVSRRPVEVTALDARAATVAIPRFARQARSGETTTWTTPSFDFRRLGGPLARHPLARHPLASLAVPDFSPSRIEVTFPDGFTASFEDTPVLPACDHTA